MNYICNICKLELKEYELKVFLSSKETLVCKKHWCECLPQSTHWRWVNLCDQCENNIICKSCKCCSNVKDMICRTCWRKKSR